MNSGNSEAGQGGQGEIDAFSDCSELPLNFTQDTTLAKGCYRALATPSLAENATLTIPPGVTIYFAAEAGLVIREGQSLLARGSREEPIILTGMTKTPGYWHGVIFDDSDEVSELTHVTVEYGGGEGAALKTRVSHSANVVRVGRGELIMTDCVIRHSGTYGLLHEPPDGFTGKIVSFERNVLSNNTLGPVLTGADAAGVFSDSNDLSGNGRDMVAIHMSGASLPRIQQPYYVLAGSIVRVREIAPGVEIIMGEDASIGPTYKGVWRGTATQPIIITGEREEPGSWFGVVVHGSYVNDVALEHVTVEYGGGATLDSGNLRFHGDPPAGIPVDIRNCTFRNSSAYGLWVDDGWESALNADYREVNAFSNNVSGDTNFLQ